MTVKQFFEPTKPKYIITVLLMFAAGLIFFQQDGFFFYITPTPTWLNALSWFFLWPIWTMGYGSYTFELAMIINIVWLYLLSCIIAVLMPNARKMNPPQTLRS